MNYSLNMYGNQIQVEMTYNSRQENNNFKKLSQYTIQGFMKKIGDNIAATHSDVTIEGRILYGNDNSEKASFTRSRNGNYNYQYSFDEETIEDLLNDEIGRYFYFNMNNLGSFNGSLEISKYDVSVRQSSSKVNVSIYLKPNSDFKKLWVIESDTDEESKFDHNYAVKNHLMKIYDLICEVTNNYEVNVLVYYDNKTIAEIDSNERISTYTS